MGKRKDFCENNLTATCDHRIVTVCERRILNKMAAKKKSTNLTLSEEHKRRLRLLKARLNRPSQTNVVETLIDEKHESTNPK